MPKVAIALPDDISAGVQADNHSVSRSSNIC